MPNEDYETQSNHLMGEISEKISKYPEELQNQAWGLVAMSLYYVMGVLHMPSLFQKGCDCLEDTIRAFKTRIEDEK